MLNWKPRRTLPSKSERPIAEEDGDILDIAGSIASFGIFVSLVKAAGLVETLRRPGPFTVFLPHDEAFGVFSKAALDSYYDPRNHDALVALLTHHISVGLLPLSALRGKVLTVANLSGDQIAIDGTNPTVMVGTSAVVETDITARNGVIQVIDAILQPSPH